MPSEEPLPNTPTAALTQLASHIYGDVASPAAKQVGEALETIFKVGLSPIKLLDWGQEQSKVWLSRRVSERVAEIPPENRVAPPYSLAVAVVSGISASHEEPAICDLFAELLLKSMDSRTASLVHPAHPVVLTQLSPQEALVLISLLQLRDAKKKPYDDSVFGEKSTEYTHDSTPSIEKQFAEHCGSLGFSDPETSQVWLDNLLRLAVIRIDSVPDTTLSQNRRWEQVEVSLNQAQFRYLNFTGFGEALIKACNPTMRANAP